jgi:soluble lytic murein transglycosylase-like protein
VTLAASGAVLLPSTAQAATCANRGTNPAASTLRSYFDASARKYALPPHLLKVMAYKESTWRQFTSSGYTVVSPGGGIGIMQLTGATAEQFDVCRLYVDTAYNIDAGAAVLQQKYAYADSRTPGTPDRSLIENWYLAVRYYNGGGSGANAYADDVVAKLRTPPSTIAPYTTAITLTRPHAVYTATSRRTRSPRRLRAGRSTTAPEQLLSRAARDPCTRGRPAPAVGAPVR